MTNKNDFTTVRFDDLTWGINVRDYESEIEDKQCVLLKNWNFSWNKLVSEKWVSRIYNWNSVIQGLAIDWDDVYHIEGNNLYKNGQTFALSNSYNVTFTGIDGKPFSINIDWVSKVYQFGFFWNETTALSSFLTQLNTDFPTYTITRSWAVFTFVRGGNSINISNPWLIKKIQINDFNIHSKIDVIIDWITYTWDWVTHSANANTFLNSITASLSSSYKYTSASGGIIYIGKQHTTMSVSINEYDRYTYKVQYRSSDTPSSGQYLDYTTLTVEWVQYKYDTQGTVSRAFKWELMVRDFTGQSEDITWTLSNTGSSTSQLGRNFIALNKRKITTVTKDASCTATRAILTHSGGTVIVSFSWNIATFNTIVDAWNFNIKADNNGASYTWRSLNATTTTTDYVTSNWGTIYNIVSLTSESVIPPYTIFDKLWTRSLWTETSYSWTGSYFSYDHYFNIRKTDYSTMSISSINHYTDIAFPDDTAYTTISTVVYRATWVVSNTATISMSAPDNTGSWLWDFFYDIYVSSYGVLIIWKAWIDSVFIDIAWVSTNINQGQPKSWTIYRGKTILWGYTGSDKIIFSKTDDPVTPTNELVVFSWYSAGVQSISWGNKWEISGFIVWENWLYVFKENEVWYTNSEKDTWTSFNFIFNKLTSNWASSQNAIAEVWQDIFYFDYINRAVRRLSYEQNLTTLRDTKVSDEISPILDTIPEDDEWNDERYSPLISLSYKYPNLELSFPDASSEYVFMNGSDLNYRYRKPNRTLVYNVSNKSWTERTDKSVATKFPIFASKGYFGSESGAIYKSFSWNTLMEWELESKLYTFWDDVMYKKYWRLDIVWKVIWSKTLTVEIIIDWEVIDERSYDYNNATIREKIDLYDIGQWFKYRLKHNWTWSIEIYDVQLHYLPTQIQDNFN